MAVYCNRPVARQSLGHFQGPVSMTFNSKSKRIGMPQDDTGAKVMQHKAQLHVLAKMEHRYPAEQAVCNTGQRNGITRDSKLVL